MRDHERARADTAAGHRSSRRGQRLMEWIDEAGYACAVGWAGAYCVTASVGNVRHRRPIAPGSLIEVVAPDDAQPAERACTS